MHENDLKEAIRENGMVHFSIEGVKGRRYLHHFLAYNETDEETGVKGFAIAEFRENVCGRCYGVAQVNLTHYLPFDSENDVQLPFDFKRDKICTIVNTIRKEDTENLDKAKTRMLLVVGDTDYDIVENNCEHIANYIMRGTQFSIQAREKKCQAMSCNIFIQSMKSLLIIIATCACFVATGVGTVLRRAHEKLLFEIIVNKKASVKNNSSDCDHFLGKTIIQSTRVIYESGNTEHVLKKYQNITKMIDDIIENLHAGGDEICKIASDLGVEVFLRMSVYFLVTWLFFQTIALLLYVYKELIPLKMSLERKRQENRYCKILVTEILAAYLPIPISYSFACFVQFYFVTRAFVFFITIVITAVASRLLVSLICSCFTCSCCCMCYWNCCCGQNKPCSPKRKRYLYLTGFAIFLPILVSYILLVIYLHSSNSLAIF